MITPKPFAISAYATAPAVRRAVAKAQAAGIEVGALELAPGGVIRIFTAGAFPAPPKDEFEQWEQSGKLD